MSPEVPKFEVECKELAGWGSLEGVASPSPAAPGSVESCKLPSGIQDGSPTAQRFPFSALMIASPDIVVLLIVDHKKMTKFLYH